MTHGQPAAPCLLLIATPGSYRTAAYLAAARTLDIDVLVASEGRHSLVSAIAAGLHVDLSDPGALEVLLEANRRRPFHGVVATDDDTVELASRIAEQLGLPHNPPEAARRTRRKDQARQALQAAGVRVPAFQLVDLAQPLSPQLRNMPLPAVLKPLALSGSRGVIRVDDMARAQAACARIEALLRREPVRDAFAASHLLLESFVPGPEVAIEGLLHSGELHVLALFDKPDPLNGPYFEETYYIMPSRHDAADQDASVACVRQACAALGLREGPVHAELRLGPQGPVIMEVASRTIGGECARLLVTGTGHTLESLVIAHATGQPLACEATADAAGVLMIPTPGAGILRRVEGIPAARAVPGIEDVSIAIRDGYELVPLPDGSSYLGFIFARAPAPAAVESALRAAHDCLNVVIAPLIGIEDRRVLRTD